jgi:hypothetical protein
MSSEVDDVKVLRSQESLTLVADVTEALGDEGLDGEEKCFLIVRAVERYLYKRYPSFKPGQFKFETRRNRDDGRVTHIIKCFDNIGNEAGCSSSGSSSGSSSSSSGSSKKKKKKKKKKRRFRRIALTFVGPTFGAVLSAIIKLCCCTASTTVQQ